MPRYPAKEPSIATIAPQQPEPDWRDPPDVAASERKRDREYLRSLAKTNERSPYAEGGPWSWFLDRLTVERARRRRDGTFTEPRFQQEDPGPGPEEVFGAPTLEAAQRRLASVRERRDISSGSGSVPDLLRPSMPGRLQETFGRAARRTSGLVDALPRLPLERGMVDNSGTQMLVRFPALVTGTAVAAQAENQAVQETDPTSTGIAAPLGSIVGQVDASKQLVEFSNPAMDSVLADDLGARLGESLDAQLFNGSGSAPNLRGFLQWSGILSITGVVTTQATYLQSLWQAFSQLSGSSGYGDAERTNYFCVLHPRRFSWLQAGFAVPMASLLPGRLVLVPNSPTNLGAGTNEDHSLVIDKTAVQLVSAAPQIRVFEEVGSGTGTIRFSAHIDAALAVLNSKAVSRITAGTPPAGF
jgi:Phage capsid family